MHSHCFKKKLRIAKYLPEGDILKPLDELALQWYYMSYHKNNRKKFVLSGKTLNDETIESVMTFFQDLFEQKKLDGTIKRQEVDPIHKRLLCEASEKLHGRICKASNGRSQHARREIALHDVDPATLVNKEIGAIVVVSMMIVMAMTAALPTER